MLLKFLSDLLSSIFVPILKEAFLAPDKVEVTNVSTLPEHNCVDVSLDKFDRMLEGK
jgi:hypothetical protein